MSKQTLATAQKPYKNNTLNQYQQQYDYGQNENKENDNQKYEIYQKEDYDQYMLNDNKKADNQYYYDADNYNEQLEKENQENDGEKQQDQDQQQIEQEQFEEIPHIKKILQAKQITHQLEEQSKCQDEDNEQEQDDDEEEIMQQEQKQLKQKQQEQQKAKIIIQNGNNTGRKSIKSVGMHEREDDEETNDRDEGSQKTGSSNYLKSTKSFQTKSSFKQEERDAAQVSEPFDNIYNTKKYPLGLADDPELDDQRKNLWKSFGRDCPAGRELFSLYKCHQPPKINYPKLKQKTAEEMMSKTKELKTCPQKASILYPPLSYKEIKPRFYKVDLIPKRKPESEIRRELEDTKRNPYIPLNRGVNRMNLIENLQLKFKYLRGGLPKSAELPFIDQGNMTYNEEMVKKQAQKRLGMKNKKFFGQTGEEKSDGMTNISNDPVQECNEIFDQIMEEIEERQEYLNSIEHLKEVGLKKKIKQEIIERVAELQKVTEIKQKYL